jgi:peptidyl-prolyl cis-trans isomerase D
MLSSMRTSKKNQPFVYALMGLLALGLIGFASGGVDGARVNSIGSVGEEPIPVTSYAQSLRNTVQNVSQQIGRQVSAQEVAAFGLQAEALQNVVSGAALSSEANRLALSAGDDLVAEEIVATPAFTGIDGNFDKEAYEFTLERSGLSTKEYEQQTRQAIARGLIESAVASGAKTPDSHALVLIEYAREQRNFDWASIDATVLTERAANPTDAQIAEQYEAAPALYTSPLTRELTYVTLSPEMLADQVEIPDGILQEDYNAQPERFSRPARRAVERIIFADEEAANTAKAQMDEGVTTFDTIATDRGLTLADIDLGDVEQGQLNTQIDQGLFGTKELGIFGPYNTDLGPALFRVNAIMDAQNTTFEEAKEELSAEYVGEESRRLIVEMVSDIDDLLAQGLTLEEIATETAMTLSTISMTATTEDGIAAYDEFRNEAFAARKGGFPELKDLSDGGIFALRLDEVVDPALRQLDEVKDQVVQDWAVAEDQKSLEAFAQDLAQKLDTGATFESLNLTPNTETDATRDAFVDGVPAPLLQDIFTSDIGKTSQVSTDASVVLARLNEVVAFDPNSEDGKLLLSQVGIQLSNQVTGDLLRLFATALEERDGVSLNQTAINQINSQILGGTGG